MSALNIVLLSIAGAFSIASIVFMILFIIEITVSSKQDSDEVEVKSIFSSENYVKEENVDSQVSSISSMLEKLDKQASEELVTEVSEEKAEEVVETEDAKEDVAKEEKETEVQEEVVENIEKAEEVVETAEKEVVEETKTEEQSEETIAEVEGVKVEEIVGETISVESLPDYKARLDKIIENRDKINKDLIKVEKSILNYERTKRRKARNQKMLDRRASELTNLNLVM